VPPHSASAIRYGLDDDDSMDQIPASSIAPSTPLVPSASNKRYTVDDDGDDESMDDSNVGTSRVGTDGARGHSADASGDELVHSHRAPHSDLSARFGFAAHASRDMNDELNSTAVVYGSGVLESRARLALMDASFRDEAELAPNAEERHMGDEQPLSLSLSHSHSLSHFQQQQVAGAMMALGPARTALRAPSYPVPSRGLRLPLPSSGPRFVSPRGPFRACFGPGGVLVRPSGTSVVLEHVYVHEGLASAPPQQAEAEETALASPPPPPPSSSSLWSQFMNLSGAPEPRPAPAPASAPTSPAAQRVQRLLRAALLDLRASREVTPLAAELHRASSGQGQRLDQGQGGDQEQGGDGGGGSAWLLAEALWGEMAAASEHDEEMRRRAAVSAWLEHSLQPSSPPAPAADAGLVLQLLSRHQVAEAVDAAIRLGDLRLATLAAGAGQGEAAQRDVQRQLALWRKNGLWDDMDAPHRHIYSLLAGEINALPPSTSPSPSPSPSAPFSPSPSPSPSAWLQDLALRLWYGEGALHRSLAAVLRDFGAAFVGRRAAVPVARHSPDHSDLRYHLLRLFCGEKAALIQALDPLARAASPLDAAESYCLALLLRRAVNRATGLALPAAPCTPRLLVALAEQAEALGLWQWAAAALQHAAAERLIDGDSCARAVAQLLDRHCAAPPAAAAEVAVEDEADTLAVGVRARLAPSPQGAAAAWGSLASAEQFLVDMFGVDPAAVWRAKVRRAEAFVHGNAW
jgi:hypothetical protein